MIYHDKYMLPVNKTLDGMDSAVRAGILTVTTVRDAYNLGLYERAPGYLARHPYHIPSCNIWNFTRDQLSCLIAGLYRQGRTDILRRVFFKTAGRWFFSQSFERDMPGSKKYLWPHTFYKDSLPNNTTKLWPNKVDPIEGVEIESRIADFADPLGLSVVGALAKATGLWYLKPFVWAGLIHLYLSIILTSHHDVSHKELNQLFCLCFIMGPRWLRLLRDEIPGHEQSFFNYWNSKGEVEYAWKIIDVIKKA